MIRSTLALVVVVLALTPKPCAEQAEVPRASLNAERGYNLEGKRQQLAIEQMRLLAIALNEYAHDYRQVPKMRAGRNETESLQRHLTPDYLNRVPQTDPWCGPYLYWSDGLKFVIVSAGADGVTEHDYNTFLKNMDEVRIRETICGGETSDAGADIVWLVDNLCQWPAGIR